jgi:regulator of protease activity HflC (stomatin/prohibitin superfamily)
MSTYNGNANQPLAEAIDRSFVLIAGILCVLALVWLSSGIRFIKPGEQAVHLRFGAVNNVQEQPGLLLALPAPFDEVITVPSADRQLELSVDDFAFNQSWQAQADQLIYQEGNDDDVQGVNTNEKNIVKVIAGAKAGLDPRQDGGFVVTADQAIVHLSSTLIYHCNDPVAFALGHEQIQQLLRRSYAQAAVHACAQYTVDALRSTDLGTIKGLIASHMNRLLRTSGVAIQRVDVTVALPERAILAYERAERAIAEASQRVAKAQTQARRIEQNARTKVVAIQHDAHAAADELLAQATERTVGVLAEMQHRSTRGRDESLIRERRYRATLDGLLPRLDAIHLVPPGGSLRLDIGKAK